MNLFAETIISLRWAAQVVRQFLRVVPGITTALVVYLTVARITRMLAFLLPLKVILLASSNGVPLYFHPFLREDQKQLGIIILSLAAITFYALTLFLEGHTKKLAAKAGADLMNTAGVMSLVDNQHARMQSIYARFMQIVSGVAFLLASMMVLTMIHPVLAIFLCFFISITYLLSAWSLSTVTLLKRNKFAGFVEGQLGNYLSILSSVAFLSGFLVILQPFLREGGANVLIAIICFLLLRQVTSAMTGVVKDTVSLIQKRQLIDTLVFPYRQFHQPERNDQRTLRELFGQEERNRLVAHALTSVRLPGEILRVSWLDTSVRGMAEFAVVLKSEDGQERHFRLRAFPPRMRRMPENEDLLFRHISREAVWAAPITARFMHGDHECILYEAGIGTAPKGKTRGQAYQNFIANLWSIRLPAPLIRIYSATHKPLHKRLTNDLISRMEIAADGDGDVATLVQFSSMLPVIRKLIAQLPLCLACPTLEPNEILFSKNSSMMIISGWGQWSVLPLGVGLPTSLITEKKLKVILANVSYREAPFRAKHIDPRQIIMAARCAQLERLILLGKMKKGLALAGRIIVAFPLESGPP